MKSTALVPQPKFGSAAMRVCSHWHCLSFPGLGWRMGKTSRFSCLTPSIIRNCSPFYRSRLKAGSADKPEGSTEDVGGFRITNVHRDYHKGEGDNAPTAAISILDSVRTRITSMPRPLHGIATAKPAKVTANLSRSMAMLVSKLSRKKANTPLSG